MQILLTTIGQRDDIKEVVDVLTFFSLLYWGCMPEKTAVWIPWHLDFESEIFERLERAFMISEKTGGFMRGLFVPDGLFWNYDLDLVIILGNPSEVNACISGLCKFSAYRASAEREFDGTYIYNIETNFREESSFGGTSRQLTVKDKGVLYSNGNRM